MIVQQGQNMMDLAVQHSGDCTALFAFAMKNGISVTEEIASGMDLIVPEVINIGVVKYFSDKTIIPAFEKAKANPIVGGRGIGFMRIGSDFKVG